MPWRVPSSPGNGGDNAAKKSHNIIFLHLPQMCPCSEWHKSTLSPPAPFISTLRSWGRGKKNKNKTRQTMRRDYSDYSGRNIAHLYPWLHRSLSLGSEYSDTVVLGQRGRKQSWFLLFQLIARAEALWWCCTDVQHLACSQGKIKVLAVQEKSKRAKLSS